MEKNKNFFTELNSIDVTKWVEKKNGLSYLSWANAWAEFKKRYPEAIYTIYKDSNGLPYMEDTELGIMCYTTVTANGLTHEMWLPVMDGANKAMRRTPYTYKVWDKHKNQFVDKTVAAATMFDINKTIMRCLVKNLAMFGLGLYIYAGEDLPETSEAPAAAPQQKQDDSELKAAFETLRPEIETASSKQALMDIFNWNVPLQDYLPFKEAMSKRRKELGL